MVQARLDAEEPDAKRVLRAASVFGERFSRAGVAALLGGEARGRDASATGSICLCARELVARVADAARGGGDVELTFATRWCARPRTRCSPRRTARSATAWPASGWSRQGSSDAMVLAEHFRRGGEPARAVRWYLRAAEQALQRQRSGAPPSSAPSCGIDGRRRRRARRARCG